MIDGIASAAWRATLLIVLALTLSGCSTSAGIGGVTVVAEGRHDLAAGTTILGALAVGGGSASLPDGSAVAGDVFLLAGELRIDGLVEGDVSAIGGSLTVGPSGHIGGTLRTGGGAAVSVDASSRIDGGIEEGAALPAAGPPPDLQASLVGLFGRVVGLVLFAVGLRQLARRRVSAVGRYLATMPAASVAYGFLLGVVGLSLAVFMAFTIVLIPVAMLGLLVLAAAIVVGVAGLLDIAAARFGLLPAAGLLVLGLSLASLVPVIGQWLVAIVLLAALGATGLTLQRPFPRTAGAGDGGPALADG